MNLSHQLFYEIAALLAIATCVGSIALWLKQPLIMAFIAVGVMVGPAGMGLISNNEPVELFAELGIALLLFVVGLKLDPGEIKAVGPVAIITGMGQIILTGSLGFIIALLLGFNLLYAFYIGVCLTFSSTIIIVKLLSDKREIDALHSRLAVGILIIQDITVVLVMIALTVFNGGNKNLTQAIFMVFLKGSIFLVLITFFTRYFLSKILHNLAKSTELLILFSITWAISLAALAQGLGFSKEVGAFLAGVAIASTSYRVIIAARLVSLRDFLLLFFFINLGLHIDINNLGSEIIPSLLFSIFVLLGKPLIIITLLGLMGYRKYTSSITSLSLSQISEFSLILATLGISLGHINQQVMGLITLVGLITMGFSTYLILYSHFIYKKISPWLNIFERNIPHSEEKLVDSGDFSQVDVILFGLGRYGGSMLQYLQIMGLQVLGVDFDPQLVRFWRNQGVLTYYGDVENPEFAKALPLNHAQWVVSTIPGENHGLTLLHTLKHYNFQGKIVLTCHSLTEKEILKKAGADIILLPFQDAANEAARLIINNY